jgi:hypothetical protein
LYDQKSKLLANVTRTTVVLPNAPEFPDRSLAVFSNISSEGAINNIHTIPPVTTPPTPAETTSVFGVRLAYTNLMGADSGHFWKLNQNYNAQANQLILNYSAVDSPQMARIELKNDAGIVLYQTNITLQQGAKFTRLAIDLPNWPLLANVKEIDFVVDPDEGGDATGDFTIHAINFQHVPSSQNLTPAAGIGTSDVTTLPGSGVAQLASSPVGATITKTPPVYQVSFDLRTAGAFSELYANFDPSSNGSSINLTTMPNLIFGVDSTKATSLKLEVEDTSGKRATYYIRNVDVSRNYYKFLTSSLSGNVDATHIKALHFTAETGSVSTGNEVGTFRVEIGGLS